MWTNLQGAPLAPPGQAGWLRDQEKPRSNHLTLNHYPVRGVMELSRLFLDAAATPPGQEGQGAPCRFVHTLVDNPFPQKARQARFICREFRD